jgi:hypothetical protein
MATSTFVDYAVIALHGKHLLGAAWYIFVISQQISVNVTKKNSCAA